MKERRKTDGRTVIWKRFTEEPSLRKNHFSHVPSRERGRERGGRERERERERERGGRERERGREALTDSGADKFQGEETSGDRGKF